MAGIEKVVFDLAGLQIAGLRSNAGARHQVLAVHGWLDNANSFAPMMPLLDDIDLVAIDLPGHGHSSHLSEAANYHLIDTPFWFFKVADALEWDSFHILGHSLGGCLAPLAAVTDPSRIKSIMLLEASGPLAEPPSKLPARLQKSHSDKVKAESFTPKSFRSIEEGVEARLLATKMARNSARLIVERQMEESEPGTFVWRYDHKHRLRSPLYLVEDQVLQVLSAVECPSLVVLSEDGIILKRPESPERFSALNSSFQETVAGDHHMHMDDPEPSAGLIRQFLDSLPGQP